VSAHVVITDCDFGRGEIERDIIGRAGLSVGVCETASQDEIVRLAQGARALLVQYTRITPRLLDELPDLVAVVRYGTGLDTIDLDAAAERGVQVRGVTDYCTDEVADHTVALMLASTRRIVIASNRVLAGDWPKPTELGAIRSLRNSTVGLVGFGRIGQAVASRLVGFGVRVLAHDVAPVEAGIDAVRMTSLEAALACDIVSLHRPAAADHPPLIGASELARMGPAAGLVNVARGGLVDSVALAEAIRAGRLGWAALDVTEIEGAEGAFAFRDLPNVIITPHIAYYSPQSLDSLRRKAAEQVLVLLGVDA